jgi:hypothetical protein
MVRPEYLSAPGELIGVLFGAVEQLDLIVIEGQNAFGLPSGGFNSAIVCLISATLESIAALNVSLKIHSLITNTSPLLPS